jgi:hypothetical protein
MLSLKQVGQILSASSIDWRNESVIAKIIQILEGTKNLASICFVKQKRYWIFINFKVEIYTTPINLSCYLWRTGSKTTQSMSVLCVGEKERREPARTWNEVLLNQSRKAMFINESRSCNLISIHIYSLIKKFWV